MAKLTYKHITDKSIINKALGITSEAKNIEQSILGVIAPKSLAYKSMFITSVVMNIAFIVYLFKR